ncbi:hypothetical protein TMPK1_16940 [Rhodospirillales bacterium TMPK1]|uniref:Copper chaperone PCu(A)C n=2 Tax=Roseiterribacter gracilis TaxID=2812848 RepID=A0A8S8XDM9_9PROT|nr:hypothetical protein TMPK1_16940 [Rhodospirillales bacterium TMPK1]
MRTISIALAISLLAAAAVAHDTKHGSLHLVHPHAAPVEEGGTCELTLTISNSGGADQLLAIETEIARVELAPTKIPAKAKNLVVHAKLLGARRTYNDSEMVPATFVFAKAGRIAEEIMIDR